MNNLIKRNIKNIVIFSIFTLAITACFKSNYKDEPYADALSDLKNSSFIVTVDSEGDPKAISRSGKYFSRCTQEDACRALFNDIFNDTSNSPQDMRAITTLNKGKVNLNVERVQGMRWAIVQVKSDTQVFNGTAPSSRFSLIESAHADQAKQPDGKCPALQQMLTSSAPINQLDTSDPDCEILLSAYAHLF